MKKLLSSILLVFVLATACTAQVYHGQHPHIAPVKQTPFNKGIAPSINLGWKKADVSGLSVPMQFDEFTVTKDGLVPALALKLGIAQMWGGADVKIEAADGDTTYTLQGVVYWGIAATAGLTNLFTQLYSPNASSNASPSFTTCLLAGVNDIALNAGVEWLDKNYATNTVVIKPSFKVGITANVREFFKNSTNINLQKPKI